MPTGEVSEGAGEEAEPTATGVAASNPVDEQSGCSADVKDGTDVAVEVATSTDVAVATVDASVSEDASREERIREALRRCEAPIKPQFLVVSGKSPTVDDKGSGDADSSFRRPPSAEEPPKKKPRRGQNKSKDRIGNVSAMRLVRASQLCSRLAYVNACPGETDANACKHNHDISACLAAKAPPISDKCPVLESHGFCAAGLNCRFGGHELQRKNVDCNGVELCSTSPWVEKMPSIGQPLGEKNVFDYESIGKLQKRNLDFARSEAIVKEWNRHCSTPGSDWESRVGSVVDDDRRKVDLRNKVVLAPLTTVGNLPFRRLCMGLGCEVTVGEMALASTILEGKPAELALLRRHESETCFGVQVAGGDVETMTKVAQFIDENVDCDFVDINSGCPLDELHRRGSGSRLMSRVKHMEGIVRGMSSVLKTKPLTLKMRTAHIQEHGQKADDPQGRCAHKLVPLLEEWGVGAITIHGRTARQRYSKFADWNYISECASRRKKMVPLIGGGDILNWEDVEEHRSKHGVDSFMIGRGALIKPWLFTEIKEKRHWDISASERFDMLRNFTNYGLDHWGSDARGVETTRRFLLEWLSFTCRYVPIGLLEQMPPKLNWRPRTYIGRSDMETKLGSQQSNDWVTISEMLLGPVPEGFTFVPKHKSKAYDTSEGQQSQTEQG